MWSWAVISGRIVWLLRCKATMKQAEPRTDNRKEVWSWALLASWMGCISVELFLSGCFSGTVFVTLFCTAVERAISTCSEILRAAARQLQGSDVGPHLHVLKKKKKKKKKKKTKKNKPRRVFFVRPACRGTGHWAKRTTLKLRVLSLIHI